MSNTTETQITKLPAISTFATQHSKGNYTPANYQEIQTLLTEKVERFEDLNNKERLKISKAEEKIELNEAKKSQYTAYQDMLTLCMSRLSESIDNEDALYVNPNSAVLMDSDNEDTTVQESTKVM